MSTIPSTDAALLAAQAKAGQAGVDAYNAAKDELTKQRQSAVDQAMREAALRGAPTGAVGSIASTITAPYDQRIASVTQAAGSAGEAAAAQQQRMAAYNSAANASRGLIPGQIELAVAPIRAKSEFNVSQIGAEGRREVDKINAQIRLMEAQAAAAAAKAGGGGGGGGRGGGGGGGGRTPTAAELKSALAQGAQMNLSTQAGQLQQTAQSVPNAQDVQAAVSGANYAGRSQQYEQAKAGGASKAILNAMLGIGGVDASGNATGPAAAAPSYSGTQGGGGLMGMLSAVGGANQLLGTQGRSQADMNTYYRTGQMPGTPKKVDIAALARQISDATKAAAPQAIKYQAGAPIYSPTEQTALDRLRAMQPGRDFMANLNTSPTQVAQTAFRSQLAATGNPIAPDFRFPEAIRAPSGLSMMNVTGAPLKMGDVTVAPGESYAANQTPQGEVTTGSRAGIADAAQRLLDDPAAMQQAMRDYAPELVNAGLKINPEDVINAISTGVYQPGQSASQYADVLGGSKQRKAVEAEQTAAEKAAKTATTEGDKATDTAADQVFISAFGQDPSKIPGVPRAKVLDIAATPEFKTYVAQLQDAINPFSSKSDVQTAIEGVVPRGLDSYANVVRILNSILAAGSTQAANA